MNVNSPYFVLPFKSVSYVLKAEKILQQEGIAHKLIPVPKHISTDCGICLRFDPAIQSKIAAALADKVEIEEIRELIN